MFYKNMESDILDLFLDDAVPTAGHVSPDSCLDSMHSSYHHSQQQQMGPQPPSDIYSSQNNNSFETESDTSYVSSSTSPSLLDNYEAAGGTGQASAEQTESSHHTYQNNYYCSTSTTHLHDTAKTKDPHLHAVVVVKPPGKKRGPRPKILTFTERKQKRLDANDRERQRMGQLSVAFDNLRNLLPKHGNDRELSKFETVQIAKNYIRALNQMLVQADAAAVTA